DAGKSYAFYGSASGLSTTSNWSSSGEHGGGFGYAVAGAGDVNGDGYSDVIVSAPLFTSAGRAYIFYGSTAKVAL
ncbi:MAG: integrin alpha, partial [Chloroflexi bacterium]|nr:integrin alpha [Chloroflexota bacterium]